MQGIKKLLFIGAGWEQEELIKTAKRMGYEVIATHPHLDEQVVPLVDRYFVRESDDIDSHLKLAQTFKVEGIITDNCDYSLYTATFVAEKLGLPSVGLDSAYTALTKLSQRSSVVSSSSVNNPMFGTFNNVEDYRLYVQGIGFPFIVKPNDSRGTFGVTIVKEESQVNEAYFHAISNSPSRTGIIESFIEGTLFTVDGFCFDDKHRALGVASRKFIDGPHPVTKEIVYPAQVSDDLIESLKSYHEDVVDLLGYTKGHSHGEYIVNSNNKIFLVECTNRGGGVYTSSTIAPEVSGINLNEALIKQMTGQKVNGKDPENNPVVLSFLDFEVGKTIKSINTGNQPYVLKFRSIYGEKDMVESVENCASRHMMLVIKGGVEELDDFKSKLQITYY